MTTPFESEIDVAGEDIDELGHVNNVTYLRWVQDVAVAHWNASASEDDKTSLAWVVRRHEIDYKRPAFSGDHLTLRTWVGKPDGLRFERFTEILRDGKLLAKARTEWVPISRETGKPVPLPSSVRELFPA